MSKVCKTCGSESFASSNEGSLVCTQCGDVKESANIVSEVQFGGDSSIVGTFVSATRRPTSSYRSLGGRDSRAMSMENARRRLDEIGTSLRIRTHLIDSAQRSFELAMENNFTKGRKTKLVAASCLYIVCRREKTPHLLIDFSEVLQINVFVLAHTFLELIKLLNIHLPIVDPSFFIQRFASNLEFGDQTKDVVATANKLVARMKRDWMATGRKPSGICGASLYIASKIHGFKRSMKEIIHIVKIGEATLIARLDEFRKTPSASLRFDEFSGMDLEDECDPPSFTRNRLKEIEQEEKQKKLEEKRERKQKRKEKREKRKLERQKNQDIETIDDSDKKNKKQNNKKLNDSDEDEEVEDEEEIVDKTKSSSKKDKNDNPNNEDDDEEEEEEDDEEEEEEEEEDSDDILDDIDLDEYYDKDENSKKRKSKSYKKEERKVKKSKSSTNSINNKSISAEEEIVKESNELVKQSSTVQNLTDVKGVESVPTTLLENIARFEQIQLNIQTEAGAIQKEVLKNKSLRESSNNNNNNNKEDTTTTTSTQQPTTTQSTDSTNTQSLNTTTTTTTTQELTQQPSTTTNTAPNNNTQQPSTQNFNKTMSSKVNYPELPSQVNPSVFLPTDNLENLSDSELDLYIEQDKDTIHMKGQIWEEINKEWIEKNEERQREIEEDIKAGRPPRKRKVVNKKSAENAQAAAEEELKKRTRNAKLVEKLGLFKPNFVNGIFGGGGGASQTQAAVGSLLAGGKQTTQKDSTQKDKQQQQQQQQQDNNNNDDDDEDDYESHQAQSSSLLSQMNDNYGAGDYDEDY